MIEGDRSIHIEAHAAHVHAMIVDAETFPEWNPIASEVEVLERDAHGRPASSRVVLDAKVRTVALELDYAYGDDPRSMRFASRPGGDVKSVVTTFTVHEHGPASCEVRMEVGVDPGRGLSLLLRGPVVDRVTAHVFDGTLKNLKERAESA